MNKKLIAAAVSAAVIAPVAAQAESSFYASIRNVIDIKDISSKVDAESTTDISTMSSRFGFKGNTDIGNGMTAHGRYEFSTTTDKEGGGVEDTRIATVGLSGSFGRVDVGNQWSSYFNTFGTLVSPTYSLGFYLYSSVGGGAFRASNTIKYSNTFGPLYAELDVRLNGSDEDGDAAETLRGDGMGLGLTYAVTDNISIAAAFDSEDTDEGSTGDVNLTLDSGAIAVDGGFGQDQDRLGIAVKATFGDFWGSLGWQTHERADIDVNYAADVADAVETALLGTTATGVAGTLEFEGQEVDTMFFWVGGSLGEKTNWNIGYAVADDGVADDEILVSYDSDENKFEVISDTDDSEQLTWGIYHNMGGGMKLFYEATSIESENKEWDGDQHLLGMRIDF